MWSHTFVAKGIAIRTGRCAPEFSWMDYVETRLSRRRLHWHLGLVSWLGAGCAISPERPVISQFVKVSEIKKVWTDRRTDPTWILYNENETNWSQTVFRSSKSTRHQYLVIRLFDCSCGLPQIQSGAGSCNVLPWQQHSLVVIEKKWEHTSRKESAQMIELTILVIPLPPGLLRFQEKEEHKVWVPKHRGSRVRWAYCSWCLIKIITNTLERTLFFAIARHNNSAQNTPFLSLISFSDKILWKYSLMLKFFNL